MKLNELLNHFEKYPDVIVYYDPRKNIEERVENYGRPCSEEYATFFCEYSNTVVADWYVDIGSIMFKLFVNFEGEENEDN